MSESLAEGQPDLRTVFNLAAEDYQRTRPVCPPELFDDRAGAASPAR
jgi:hypothetical protein